MTDQPRRSYDLLLENIEADLRSGAISLGDQLPGERTLADTYGISRASVREGIRILDAMGVLRSSSGSGPKSGAIIISEPSAGLSSALRLHMASSRLPVSDIVQTRVLLETWAAAAAANLPPSDAADTALANAAALLDAMDAPGIDREAFHVLDAQFHVVLSSLAGNAVIETMMASLSGAISGYVKKAVDGMDDWPAVMTQLQHQHHGIYDAVASRRGDDAAARLREHIVWFHAQIPRGDQTESNAGQ
ncbi:FadR/GntR family transcriptional regulator [Arthrobacter sunyaminii]|uniref:FadR/GntR family transcriptional regulator n=1 Tax=Arthrobacter sunyaminii TaxID=2816859 RepID=UPI001A952918|nr:FCD domain-containing protein [Arthrobacter sunyaminii]MBO0896213.1 FadR family transcriptional regulator [Arthrobacter sunyaminii]